MNSDQTLYFYNQNADDFISRTVTADMESARIRFTACLPPNASILDFGCGSGRDTRAFLDAGYRVDAMDGSEALCVKASAYTGIQVKNMLFTDLNEHDAYDGIWACASILHLPKDELADVLRRIETALRPHGVLYASFKYGTYEGMRNGRFFCDFTDETLHTFWEKSSSMQIFDTWLSMDVRSDREEVHWLNLLARRV